MFVEIDYFGTTRSFRSGMLVSLRWSEILFRVRCYKHFAPSGARRVQGSVISRFNTTSTDRAAQRRRGGRERFLFNRRIITGHIFDRKTNLIGV